MSLLSSLSHSLIHRYYKKRINAFKNDMSSFKDFQLKQLSKLLALSEKTTWGQKHKVTSDWDYDIFSSQIPVTDYKDYEKSILNQMENKSNEICIDCNRYQPTSGSTSGRKWIPYSKEFTQELNMAIGPWIGNLYSTYPRIKGGKHYWSLSWMPNELREKLKDLDDLNVFSKWQQVIMRMTMASPNSVSHAKTAESAQLATLAWLCSCEDLTMLFVWSPTFALNLMDDLKKYKESLIIILKYGEWGKYQDQLNEVECPKSKRASNILEKWDEELSTSFLNLLWPKMSLISCWDTASSKPWATKLRNLFNNSSFQGKGLFATEGVVTIPFNGRYVLSYKSHFYEFEVLDESKESEDQPNRIIPSWELKNGMIVSPLITTGSGFFRYKIKDRLEVVDFMNKCPCLVFKGRMGDVDLVGEKTSPEMVELMFLKIEEKFPTIKCLSLIGVEDLNNKPYYICLCESENENEKIEISQFIESELKDNFHYTLARDLGQLNHCTVMIKINAWNTYQNILISKGMIKGDIKLEILTTVNSDQLEGSL
jgi:hypothetical protein